MWRRASPSASCAWRTGARHFALVRWGFIPSWVKEVKPGKPLINARGETVMEKPSFRNAMRRRRCLVPADGYYEWSGLKAARFHSLVQRRTGASSASPAYGSTGWGLTAPRSRPPR